ncbi:hypothetical protein TNCV_1283111 [Trichonephila clavipes]|uniref:Uncharacterized protein n=1 Tax=Trichonephila clavipes TaxID=2585209 RepID=A0A8X6SZJ3_TRICX|nr:hypothetical protein TNCV_1283111 [Trichonephila clavipes]
MTSARGRGAIVYCLNSGSDDSQTGRHNEKRRANAPLTIGEACFKRIMSSFLVLREGDNRNRWRDGQVCPDVGQGIMAPWARRPGCALRRREKRRERGNSCLGWRKGKSPALDGESMRGEPWLERAGRER